MPKATNKSSPEQSPPPSEVQESIDNQAETSSSDQELDPEISFHPAFPSHVTTPSQCPQHVHALY